MNRFGIIVFLLWAQLVFGQHLHFSNYPLFDKNQQIGVHHLTQDPNGLIWVASGDQLFTFDGLDYKQIKLPDSLAGNISTLYYDQSNMGAIWLGTSEGQIFNNTNGLFTSVNFSPKSQGYRITDIQVDRSDNIWVATYGAGVFVKTSATQNYAPVREILDQDVYCMTVGQGSGIWVGTDNGIYSCHYDGTVFSVTHYNSKDGLSDEIVKGLCLIDENLILGTQEGGLIRFSLSQHEFTPLTMDWSHGEIDHMHSYRNNEVWIVTTREGVFNFDMTTGNLRKIMNQKHVSYAQIKDIMFDREGIVWLASAQDGLNKAVRCFEFYSPGIDDIQMIHAYAEDFIYLGTSKGLYSYNLLNGSCQLIRGTSHLNIISVDQIDNHIIFGTFDEGLGIMKISNEEIVMVTEQDGLPNNSVITIAHQEGEIWLSTLAGVGRMNYTIDHGEMKIQDIEPFEMLTNDYVYDIEVYDDNSIFFATDGHGVAHYINDQILYYNLDSVANNQILSMATGRNKALWCIEHSMGLCVVDLNRKNLAGGVFSLSSEIAAVASDGNDHMLVIHKNGIDVIDEISGEVINYGTASGFDDFTPSLNAISSLPTGYTFIAGQSNVVKIQTPDTYGNSPQVHINYVKVGDRQLEVDEMDVVLDADEHTIHFNLSGLFFTNPESVSFRYQLVGHDEDWKETRDQDIIYSKLSPGRYLFQAEALSSKAIYHSGGLCQFAFQILPPIWLRWWFVMALILLLGFIVYIFIKYRERAIMKETELQNAMIERQYEVLKNQLNPHFLFNAFNTLISYIEEDPETAVEVVEKLSDFYRKILEVKEHKLVSIEQELTLLKDYVFLLNKRFANNLKLSIHLDNYQGWIPPMTLQILVENVVKHNILSTSHPLHVEVAEHDNDYLIVKNNVKSKRQNEQSTGIGLQNIDKRYRLLGLPPIKIVKETDMFSVLLPKIIKA